MKKISIPQFRRYASAAKIILEVHDENTIIMEMEGPYLAFTLPVRNQKMDSLIKIWRQGTKTLKTPVIMAGREWVPPFADAYAEKNLIFPRFASRWHRIAS